jgi:hypothetical protein
VPFSRSAVQPFSRKGEPRIFIAVLFRAFDQSFGFS